MPSSYPGGLDNFNTNHVDLVNEVIHASTINDAVDAINKIEAELGVNPSGSYTDVTSRLAALGVAYRVAPPPASATRR
jgi:hypothetical protein